MSNELELSHLHVGGSAPPRIGLALGSVGIALTGNFVGGGLLIGAYYAYVNDSKRHLHEETPELNVP